MADITPEQFEKLKGTNLGKMKDVVDGAVVDYLKGLDGMKQPGTRVRKAMLAVRDLHSAVRKELLEKRGDKTGSAADTEE